MATSGHRRAKEGAEMTTAEIVMRARAPAALRIRRRIGDIRTSHRRLVGEQGQPKRRGRKERNQ
jgi:hypothetical protein